VRPLSGRRAIVLGRLSAVAHMLEAPLFGLGLAAGILLVARKAGEIVLLDRRGAASAEQVRPGLLLLVGVVIVAASLLVFHRKARQLYQRLVAAGVAVAFFVIGYSGELHAMNVGSFFGLTTLTPNASFVEDFPARPKVRYAVNRWGLRGGDWDERPAQGVSRVAVVGDSFVFGSGVEEADTISMQLDARLRERFAGARVEVLNLGVPGNNLLSHLAMLRVAEEKLGARVLVLCLTLPNDLSAWDGHAERLARGEIGSFSFASFLFGYSTAITLWGERHLPRGLTAEGVAFFKEQMASFAKARSSSSAPLVVFTYGFEDERIAAAIGAVPGAVLAGGSRWPQDHFIPGDGHPNARGNEAFSKAIASVFQPSWL
jgi:hypothetical protein